MSRERESDQIVTNLILVAVGLALLYLGGEGLVRGAVAMAQRHGISPLVIGVTIVGLGTSAPELVVGVRASLGGASALVVGNIVGSNLANMMLIVGIAAAVRAIAVDRAALRRDSTAVAAATALFALVALGGRAGPAQGLGMIGALAAFIVWTLWSDRRRGGAAAALHRHEAEQVHGLPARPGLTAVYILGGIALLVAGAEALVEGAVALARAVGVPEEVIGLTLVALGTSLPELAASVVASARGHGAVCLGNVLGSNLFNLLAVTGAAAIAAPIAFPPRVVAFDLWALVAVTALLWLLMLTGRRVTRLEGWTLLALYAFYVAFQFTGIAG